MSGYKTRNIDVKVGALKLHLRALKDRTQYYDPDGEAKKIGICSASWSIFGQFWQASTVLAKVVKKIDLKDRRFIELGCGLALPSLILQHRGADITASDYHPLSKSFLDHNAKLNNLPSIPHLNFSWTEPDKKADRKSTRLNSSHVRISYAVFCLKKKIRVHSCARCGA